MNAHKWADLKELSDDELIAEHDAVAENTAVGAQHYLDELRYRQQACVADRPSSRRARSVSEYSKSPQYIVVVGRYEY